MYLSERGRACSSPKNLQKPGLFVAQPRSNTYERTWLRSAAFGYYPDFSIIPPECVEPHGGSWDDRTGAMQPGEILAKVPRRTWPEA
jgi:hypothetical protein